MVTSWNLSPTPQLPPAFQDSLQHRPLSGLCVCVCPSGPEQGIPPGQDRPQVAANLAQPLFL